MSEPGTGRDEPTGIEPEAVTAWFREHVEGVRPPLRFDRITGGRSNLTYDVTDQAGNQWVLRRPPTGMVLQSAHDVGRERRLMSALAPTPVPVPEVVGWTEGDEVTGAPFYVMQRVDGHVVRDQSAAEELLDAPARRHASEQLVDVMLELHAVEPADVGLAELGRGPGYIARQLKRWHGQLQQGRTRELPLLDEVHERLAADMPTQQATRIVHGDYRLDNVIVGSDGTLRAVLDWEICTLGDPLADIGLLLVYWSDPGEQFAPLLDAPTLAEGFATRAELRTRYEAGSGLDLADLDFYTAFGYWKLGAILEGVYSRYAGGVYGSDDDSWKGYPERIDRLAEFAAQAADEAGR